MPYLAAQFQVYRKRPDISRSAHNRLLNTRHMSVQKQGVAARESRAVRGGPLRLSRSCQKLFQGWVEPMGQGVSLPRLLKWLLQIHGLSSAGRLEGSLDDCCGGEPLVRPRDGFGVLQ